MRRRDAPAAADDELLGNLLGLGRLMAFVAKEARVGLGPLTVISTHAEIDKPKATRGDVHALIGACSGSVMLKPAA
jgi:hypothetical protein